MTIDETAIGNMLTDTVTIRQKALSQTGIKDITVAYTDRATGVRCKITKLSGYYAETIIGRFSTSTHIGYFLTSQTIETSDRITHGSDKYEVLEVNDCDDHHIEVILEKLKGDVA